MHIEQMDSVHKIVLALLCAATDPVMPDELFAAAQALQQQSKKRVIGAGGLMIHYGYARETEEGAIEITPEGRVVFAQVCTRSNGSEKRHILQNRCVVAGVEIMRLRALLALIAAYFDAGSHGSTLPPEYPHRDGIPLTPSELIGEAVMGPSEK